MKTYTFMFSAMLALALGITSFTAPTAQAAVTEDDIKAQRMVVKDELIDVLQEHVKFLQLVYIDRLEQKVAALQALAEQRK